jgi:hypothetical protein
MVGSRPGGHVDREHVLQRLAVRNVTASASGTAIFGTTPVPSQFVPVTGFIDRPNGIGIWTAALIGNPRVGWAPPPVVSPMTTAREYRRGRGR